MQELKLVPGKKYRGSAWVNNYGEIQFRPEQKGTKPGNLSIVLEHESFTLYESKEIFKVAVKFDKGSFDVRSALAKMTFIVTQIQQYMPRRR